uniref:ATP-binding cassette domain-containing protein n=1 Tax=Nocardia abscessus TaxID=120957 RepID=UPI002458B2FD
ALRGPTPAALRRFAAWRAAAPAAPHPAPRGGVGGEDRAAAHSAWSAAATPLSIGAAVLGALLIGITLYGPDGGTAGAMTPMALVILVLLPLSAFEAVGPLTAAAQALTTARAALHRLDGFESGCTSAGPWAWMTTRPPHSRDVAEIARTGEDRAAVPVSCADRAGHAAPGGTTSHSGSGVALQEASDQCADDGGVPRRSDDIPGAADPARPLDARVPEMPRGRRIAVVGASGAGKTTLLMKWAGLFDAPRPGVTFFAEDAHLFGTSVLENLRVARGDLTAEEAEKALRTVGLGDWLDGLPEGVHTALVGGAAAVSGGQRRRILLARALVSPARVLLLDEPTEHLEAEAGARLLRELLDVGSGLVAPDRVVLVVTHQLPEDHQADAVLRIAASGEVTTDFAVDEPPRRPADSAHREIPLPSY